jgi:hypothetical protein
MSLNVYKNSKLLLKYTNILLIRSFIKIYETKGNGAMKYSPVSKKCVLRKF